MPSAHTPEWSKIRTLKAKLQTGRCTASGGRVGRELTEEELEDCRERLAQLEQKRDQGMEDRRLARETHDNTEQLKEGQREILQAINGVSSRLDNVIAPSGSSAHHRLLAKEAAKRERDLEKVRRHLQQGIIAAEGDVYVGTVLVKADALDQLEELRDRDLEAEFSLTGLPCRLVQISGQSGIVHLLAPDLAVLKGKRKDMGYYNMRLQAFHKDLFYESVGWKAGNGPPVLLDGDDKKLPKKACLRLVVPNIIRWRSFLWWRCWRSVRRSAEQWSLPLASRRRPQSARPRRTTLGGGRGRQHHRPEHRGGPRAHRAGAHRAARDGACSRGLRAQGPRARAAQRQGPAPSLVRQGSLGCHSFRAHGSLRAREERELGSQAARHRGQADQPPGRRHRCRLV